MTKDPSPTPLPANWGKLVDATPPDVLEANMKATNRRGSRRQLGSLGSRCRRYGLTEADLIRLAVLLRHIHPDRTGVERLTLLTFVEVGGLFDIIHAWEDAEATLTSGNPRERPVTFLPYHRGATSDSRDCPPYGPDSAYTFPCPKCGSEYVHVAGMRFAEGPYDWRPCAEIAFDCESRCTPTVRFANYKGHGYAHWIDEDRAPKDLVPTGDPADYEDEIDAYIIVDNTPAWLSGLDALGFSRPPSFHSKDEAEAEAKRRGPQPQLPLPEHNEA